MYYVLKKSGINSNHCYKYRKRIIVNINIKYQLN